MGLFATLAVPFFADRVGTRRSQLAIAGLIAIVGLLVIALTPSEPSGSLVTLAGTALVGFGIGLYFPLVLTLPVDIAADPEEAASISALMLLVGYVIASTAPVVLGLVRDATGGFEGTMAIFVVVAIAMVVLALVLSPGRLERVAAARPTLPPGAP